MTNQRQITPAALPEPLEHCNPVNNHPNIVMTRAASAQCHFRGTQQCDTNDKRKWAEAADTHG